VSDMYYVSSCTKIPYLKLAKTQLIFKIKVFFPVMKYWLYHIFSFYYLYNAGL